MKKRFSRVTPAMSMNYAHVLVGMLLSRGVGMEDILRNTGIRAEELTEPEAYCSLEQFEALFLNARRLLADPAIGLRFGEQLNIASHGFLGYAVMSSETSMQAIDVAMKYIRIRNRLIKISLETNNDFAVLTFDASVPEGDFNRFLIEHIFSSMKQIVEYLGLFKLTNLEYYFAYAPPEYHETYKTVLQSGVHFNAARNQVTFVAKGLRKLSSLANPQMASFAEQHCIQQLAMIAADMPIVDRVRKVILAGVGQFPPAAEVAVQLGLSSRTLSRLLSAEGCTYNSVVDTVRYEKAKEYLLDTDWSVEDIAGLLGYSDASNFTRAFRKWNGQSPRSFRSA
jgi:AraC-like DNA-binding protein